ncbi:MAG TPA: ABC transporter ATP-binding protein [Thermotogota bacterium]|mgnify:CR=1 FL=1|nr:ABC transporter ATP-binding protein [Thermotogota bacterium]HPJ87699.1 ABC transporter ATP-binding protein [Thermotogota bacterium]HPR94862.1 ABC transporter ATP-binding protein [Thermotogota bacterium]
MPLKDSLPLSVKNVTKNFIKNKKKCIKAVDNVSFEINQGETFGVLGPNGSGKSTLIRMISTLLIPDEGTIKVFGYDIEQESVKIRALINRVSVEASFFKKLSAIENLLFTAGLYGISKKEAREKLGNIFEKIGLDKKRLNDPIEDFSRGMQQKVSIARAFLTAPRLLLLDEPTTGLDPRAKKEVQNMIYEVKDTYNTTILLTTHDMYEAEELCERVSILHKGKLRKMGFVDELKKSIPENKTKAIGLEDVFLYYTGTTLKDEEEKEQELREVS